MFSLSGLRRGIVRRARSVRFARAAVTILSPVALAIAGIVLIMVVTISRRAAADTLSTRAALQSPPRVRLTTIPVVKLPPTTPLTTADAARIKHLIRQLAQIDHPDVVLSAPTYSGTGFAPLPRFKAPDVMCVGDPDDPNHPGASALTELVRLGPRALPFLLEALDDSTPTKTVTRQGMVLMRFLTRMDTNPTNAREEAALATLPRRTLSPFSSDPPFQKTLPRSSRHIRSGDPEPYTLTVGDVCFVILGQIVGRSYAAIEYELGFPGVVVNSPTHDPELARAVRAVWSGPDPARRLLDSLLLDFATRGVLQGDEEDARWSDFGIGSDPQAGAALRLLYYFPRQAVPLVVRRLGELRVYDCAIINGEWRSSADRVRWEKRELANGVSTEEFIDAVAWCHRPAVQASLLSVFQRTDDPDIMIATLPALDREKHGPLVRQKLGGALRRQPPEDRIWTGDGFAILRALRQFGGEKVRPLYREYLNGASGAQRRFTVCAVLQEFTGEWDEEFLWPMLSDKRVNTVFYDHPTTAASEKPRLLMRVCDVAAETIRRHRNDVRFEMVGTEPELDGQIRRMQARLAASSTP